MLNTPLSYRQIIPKDCDWVMSALGSINVARNTSQIPHPVTVSFIEDWIQNWIWLANQDKGRRIVGLTTDYRGFGSAAFKKTSENTAEISFWVSPPFWRQGLAAQIITEVIRAANLEGVQEFTAGHFIDNLGSQRLLQKFGFAREPHTIWVHSQSREKEVETVRYRLLKTPP